MAGSEQRINRFGVQLQAQRTSWSAYIDAVHAVEALGFDSVWNFDHLLPFAGPVDEPCFETWTTLAAMAAKTSRIRLGALVNGVLYRDPATLAKATVTTDYISNGRLEFTLGAAWAEREFVAYGLPFPPVGERMKRLDEALDIVRALWTQPRTTYLGTYYHIEDAPCEPKPLQRPYPPITVGGGGRKTLHIAAKHADGWNGIGSPAYMAERIGILHEECRAIGRDPAAIEISVHPNLALAPTYAAAETVARTFCRNLQQDFEAERGEWLLGTPDDVRRQIQAYIDVGVSHWIMAVGAPFDLDMLALFAREVMPAFR